MEELPALEVGLLEEPTLVGVTESEGKVPLEALAVVLTLELDCVTLVVLAVVARLHDALVAELEASVGLIVPFPVVNVEGRLVVTPEDGDSVVSDTVTVEAGTVSVVIDVEDELPAPEVVAFDQTDVPVERDGEIEVGALVSSESSDELSSPVAMAEPVADDTDCVVLGRVGGVIKVAETVEAAESVGCVEFAPVDTGGLPLVGTEVEDLTDESVIAEFVVTVVV